MKPYDKTNKPKEPPEEAPASVVLIPFCSCL